MLSTYVRHLAWLGTAPQPTERRTLNGVEPITRLARMNADGITPPMPPMPCPLLIQYLMEIGPIEPAGMDAAPIGWTTMRCWQEMTGVHLEPWEARLLRQLSIDYLDQTRKARDPDCPAPWGSGIPTEDERAAISAKIRHVFGGMARNTAQA